MLALLLIKVNSVSSACPLLGLLLLYARHLSVPVPLPISNPPLRLCIRDTSVPMPPAGGLKASCPFLVLRFMVTLISQGRPCLAKLPAVEALAF